jgi:large subunit ribosomal protein L35
VISNKCSYFLRKSAKNPNFALHFRKRQIAVHCPTGSQVFRLSGPAYGVSLQIGRQMPKVKTNSSAKKRFSVTGTGKITHQKSFKRHILTKKSKKRKRALNKKGLVSGPNLDFVKRLLRLK